MTRRIYLYDTTLRDGAQTHGVDFSTHDKLTIAKLLDDLGIDYLEAGWPGANPTDDAFFAEPPSLANARLTAFGMTRRLGVEVAQDTGLTALIAAHTPSVCLVGKCWSFQVSEALQTTRTENLKMVDESIRYLVGLGKEVLFDAEHYFDGLADDGDFALEVLKTAKAAGARWIVLCDTNGGSQPEQITNGVAQAIQAGIDGETIGIHCHNDTEQAVANSLAAVKAGASMVQGTINGLGERCGNANLISIIPNLILKLKLNTGIKPDGLKRLTALSHQFDEYLNRPSNRHAAFVGQAAFAHKGGLHVSAVVKNPRLYEHIPPESIGNERLILVSDQAGKSNLLENLKVLGIGIDAGDPRLMGLLSLIKERESVGYAYDTAEASFCVLAKNHFRLLPPLFRLQSFRVQDERRWNAMGDLVTLSEAVVKAEVKGHTQMAVAEGNGPVNALDAALRKVLEPTWPKLADLELLDYKVRILTPRDGTGALTRVMIESTAPGHTPWRTLGVSTNVIDASYNALQDSIVYYLTMS
jgi:2-isopropylmalate synthase